MKLFGALFLMAKTSQLARNAKRIKLVAKYAVKRAALKAAGDSEGLQKLPRNSSPTRVLRTAVPLLVVDVATSVLSVFLASSSVNSLAKARFQA